MKKAVLVILVFFFSCEEEEKQGDVVKIMFDIHDSHDSTSVFAKDSVYVVRNRVLTSEMESYIKNKYKKDGRKISYWHKKGDVTNLVYFNGTYFVTGEIELVSIWTESEWDESNWDENNEEMSKGKILYEAYCASVSCHGYKGNDGNAPSLIKGSSEEIQNMLTPWAMGIILSNKSHYGVDKNIIGGGEGVIINMTALGVYIDQYLRERAK